MKNQSFHRQQGLTLISWVVILAFLLFQGIMAIKIIPVYVTDSSVKKVVKGLESDLSLRGKSAKQIRKIIDKRFRINSVYDMKADHVQIKKRKGSQLVIVEYEPRGTLFGNLDFIISFHHEATVLSR